MKSKSKSKTPSARRKPVAVTLPEAGAASAGSGCPVVGVGASAGGLEAFTLLLKRLPVDTGLGFVLVQHLDPQHDSALTQILARATAMPVREVTHNRRVEANHVYVIPPNTSLGIEQGVLKLGPRAQKGGGHRSIDAFFEALALDQRERAIGVILSGTATDGTLGLEAIKAEGGITFAQDESARSDSMPRSAVAAGCVDFVLSPEAIAKELERIARHPYVAGRALAPVVSAEDADALARDTQTGTETPLPARGRRVATTKRKGAAAGEALAPRAAAEVAPQGDRTGYQKVLLHLRDHSGVDFSLYKSSTILRRIARRTVLNRQETLEAYADFLKGNPTELDALYADTLIGVTSFFRNAEAFDLLKQRVFPKLLRHDGDEPVRVWVLGCSTGQEAYSIAMAFTESAEKLTRPRKLQVFATDLNEANLDKARHGLYARNLAQDVSPERLKRFFAEEEGGFRVIKPLRELVVFARQNLISDPPFSRMDLISCRNLMIYLEPSLQKKALPTFHYALKPEGFLFLGASESIGGFTDLFEPLDKKQKIFARKSAPTLAFPLPVKKFRAAPAPLDPMPRSFPTMGKELRGALDAFRGELNAEREADRVTVNQFAPPAVLINEELQILQFRGPTGAYLEPPTGKASFDLLKMAREGLMLPLRAVINKAKKEGRTARKEAIAIKQYGVTRRVNLEVVPLKNLKERCFLVLFEDAGRRGAGGSSAPFPRPAEGATRSPFAAGTKAETRRVAELERDLLETRDFLQSFQEHQEAANEELQASNEEGQSANEELQSLNEELETSKEELESTNEELTTVNEEMDTRNTELNRLNTDLTNLQTSTKLVIVLLGRDQAIRRFSAQAEKQFSLHASDIGRPFGGVRHHLDIPDLEAVIAEVIASASEREREVRGRDGCWYSLRVRPYMTFEGKADGAVLVLVDINAIKESEQAVTDARDFAEAIIGTARDPFLVLDADLRVERANEMFYTVFKATRAAVVSRSLFELGGGHWEVPKLRALLMDVLPRHSSFNNFEVTRNFETIGQRTMLLNARTLIATKGQPAKILLGLQDVSELLHFQAQMRNSELRYRRLFETSKDGVLIVDPDTRKIVEANPFMVELLGYPHEALVGKELFEIGLLKDEAASRAAFQELQENGFIRYENLPLETKHGRRREVEFVSNLYREGGTNVIQCNIRDITERRQVEDALRRNEQRYRTLFNSIDEGFCVVEVIFDASGQARDYRFLEVNPSFAKQSGLLEAAGKRVRELIPDFEEHWFEVFGRVALTGQPVRYVNEAKTLKRWFDVYAFRLGGPESRKVALLFTDITGRKAMEDALRQANEHIADRAVHLESIVGERTAELTATNQQLEAFVYSIAHDLRAPLRSMQGFSSMLVEDRESALSETARDFANRINKSAQFMDALLIDLLAFSRVSQQRVELWAVDLEQAMAFVVSRFQKEIQDSRARVECAGPWVGVMAHEPTLAQVLFNLVSNALKFIVPGAAPVIRLRAEERGGFVRVWVEDNGPGIAPEHQAEIFRLFTRLNGEKYPGTGIGLAIVQKGVERMGGGVGVESAAGRGSRFWFELKKA